MESVVIVPFAERVRMAEHLLVSEAVRYAFAKYLMEGLSTQSPRDHLEILHRYPARSGTMRRVARLHLNDLDYRQWETFAAKVQQLSNRHWRDRLPVSVLAITLSHHYNTTISELIDSGFLGFRALDLIAKGTRVTISQPGRRDNFKDFALDELTAGGAMSDQRSRPEEHRGLYVEATEVSREEGRKLINFKEGMRFDPPSSTPTPLREIPKRISRLRARFRELHDIKPNF